MYTVRKMKLGRSRRLDTLCKEAGRIYSLAVVRFWRLVRKNNVWLSSASLQRMLSNGQPTLLHSQSAQKAIQCFHEALDAWRKARKINPALRPPHKRKAFFKTIWKKESIRLIDGNLVLSNAKGTKPFVIKNWRHTLPVQVEIGWAGKEYELRASYKLDDVAREDGEVASADLGEVHPAVVGTEDFHLILNGHLLRSKRRYREKLKAKFSGRIDRMKKGGSRRRKIIRRKAQRLRRIDNQIRDIEHKLTTAAINTLHKRGVRKIVVGDVRDIRGGYDKGKVQNQRLHQAPLGRIRRMLEYKAARMGWEIAPPQNEAWTSQECPCCHALNKPKGRWYHCASCGFEAHRDVVGQVNILKRYRGESSHVIGAMASPFSLRYHPHMRCCSADGGNVRAAI